MATLRQKKVAKLIVEGLSQDKTSTGKELLASVGYGAALQDQPGRVLRSEGVQEELKNYGFDTEIAKSVVAEILIAGENDMVKLKAADMIFKVNDVYAAEKRVTLNIDMEDTEVIRDLAQTLNAIHGGTNLSGDGVTSSPLG